MDSFKSLPSDCAVGVASNGGSKRYLIEAESTTGFVAWRLENGTILVNPAETADLPASPSLTFWACAGYQDTTPVGDITYLDCHGNELIHLDVTRLKKLKFLDCGYNRITSLNVTGLVDLEVLDADNNQLTSLAIDDLHALRILNCANNRLTKLDLSGLNGLQIVDYAGNPFEA